MVEAAKAKETVLKNPANANLKKVMEEREKAAKAEQKDEETKIESELKTEQEEKKKAV
jgi:hypothetical protein